MLLDDFKFDKCPAFHNYIQEDKSAYPTAASQGYTDPDNDFLIGNSGGFLMNISFTFVNTHLLRPAGEYYETHGVYTHEEVDSYEHKKFRKQEEYRRKYGYTAPCKKLPTGEVVNLRITGEHYNFLNYVPILRFDKKTFSKTGIARKKLGLPYFFDSQYWWYKVKEFSRANYYNLIVCKTRRAGFTYMEGKGSANRVNLYPNITIILAAWDKKYITQGNSIASMVLEQLEFYETSTPFKRGILSRDLENIKLGYKDKQNIEHGYKSRCVSVSTKNNDNAAIGKDGDEVKIDELGNMKNYDGFTKQTDATLKTGTFVTGQQIGFGTINSDSDSAEMFETNFRNPSRFRNMPFENVWDKDSRDKVCGFYKPFWWGLESYDPDTKQFAMDIDGNSIYEIAIALTEKEHIVAYSTAETYKDYVDFKGQYGNCPNDSFASGSDNLFSSAALDLHILRISTTNEYDFYRDGILVDGNKKGEVEFVSNDNLIADGKTDQVHDFITRISPSTTLDNTGCIREWFAPFKDTGGVIPENLYRIWVDPFGVDKDKKNVTNKNSFGSIYVYMMPNNFTGNKGDLLVSSYVGRPAAQAEFDKIVLQMSKRWNAKVLVESDRGTTISNFKSWKEERRLTTEPTMSWDSKLAGLTGRQYGISMGAGSSNRRLAGIGYFYEWLYTVRGVDDFGNKIYNFHYIYDIGLLREIKRWELTGNYDRVSAMIVGMYDVKEFLYSNISNENPLKNSDKNKKPTIFKNSWF